MRHKLAGLIGIITATLAFGLGSVVGNSTGATPQPDRDVLWADEYGPTDETPAP